MTDDDRSDAYDAKTIEAEHARRVAGFVKVGGKHIMVDGLVSRSGRRRIIEEAGRRAFVEELANVADYILSPRDADIFEARIINPLSGGQKWPVAELARRHGITTKAVYRSIEHSKARVFDYFARQAKKVVGG